MTKPPAIRHPRACLCPHCGAMLDASTPLDKKKDAPGPGDYSMCLHCGMILIYNPDFTMRRAEPEDLAELASEVLALLARAQCAQAEAKRRAPPEKTESKN